MANVTIGCSINGGLLIGYAVGSNGQATIPVTLAGPPYSQLNKGVVGCGFTSVDQGIYTDFTLANPQFVTSGAAFFAEPAEAGPSVPETEAALAEAARKLANARAARAQLEQEIEKRSISVRHARLGVNDAVKAVVASELDGLKAEFIAHCHAMLFLARRLATAGVSMHGIGGLKQILAGFNAPPGVDPSVDDPAWVMALSALRQDADAELPGPPHDDDERAAA